MGKNMSKEDKEVKNEKIESNKKPKKSLLKKGGKNMNIYSSLMNKRRAKKEARDKKYAEELATLPKEPIKRFFARLHPKRVFKFVFSRRGLKFFAKAFGILILVNVVIIGGLFLYYKKDLENIRLDEMKVSESVNTYLDRNGQLLWEDRGDGDYRLVADGENISPYMRKATVAIEDRNFYNHPGVDFTALIRATLSTLTGRGVQGGSTLTQQLIKQVYFSDEASNRTVSGLPRKIKEMILALEVEKMYSKEQLITMYLNESPYGGRRNGVQSAAKAYFNKDAKDLTLAESALLASIPNNPAVLNPYNINGHKALISRQHKTLDVMAEMGYITKEEAEEAKAIDILDTIKAETGQYANIKAPHFVLEVKKQLEEKYGMKTMRAGGYTIKTSIDIRAQEYAEKAVAEGAKIVRRNGSDNIALASVDVETGQVIAMVGSIDWNSEYGEHNAATALIEPGSSIKPIIDYGPLFMQREGQNYAPGTILKDENIDNLYCGGRSGCQLRNFTSKFYGNYTIRQSLGNSLNIPAVKALYIKGVDSGLEIAQKLGEKSYCADNASAGLSMALGSGCEVRAIEHANAYASIARGGVYKPLTYVLELKNSSGEIIESWKDTEGERVYDQQVAYMLSDILSDPAARQPLFGASAYGEGFRIPGVWTASKTGTTTKPNASVAKDSWMVSYSSAIATAVWNGHHEGKGLTSATHDIAARVIGAYMAPVHKDLYASEGKWKSGDQPERPKGIQTLTINGKRDIYPSWFKNNGYEKQEMTFNRHNKKIATECTPESLKETIEVSVMTDPISKNKIYTLPDGYKEDEKDDCSYTMPTVVISKYESGKIYFGVVKGSASLGSYTIYLNGKQVGTGSVVEGENQVAISATIGDNIEVVVSDSNGATSIKAKKQI